MPVELVAEIVPEINFLSAVLHWPGRLSQIVSPHQSLGHGLYLVSEGVENVNLVGSRLSTKPIRS